MNPSIARDAPAPETEQALAVLRKNALRADLLGRRKALGDADKLRADQRIGQRVVDWWVGSAITSLAVYQPIRREPDLADAYNALAAHGVDLCLPVVVGREMPLEFRRWRPGDVLEKDAMGTRVPPAGTAVVQPQALLIPCVGFNEAGFRLGYGGGFYDRTLSSTPRPLALGVCYGFGLVDFEAQPHDMPLDAILTDAD